MVQIELGSIARKSFKTGTTCSFSSMLTKIYLGAAFEQPLPEEPSPLLSVSLLLRLDSSTDTIQCSRLRGLHVQLLSPQMGLCNLRMDLQLVIYKHRSRSKKRGDGESPRKGVVGLEGDEN